MVTRIVVISDFCDPTPVKPPKLGCDAYRAGWAAIALDAPDAPPAAPEVRGGYLERLPLAAVRAGLCDQAEIWTWLGDDLSGDRLWAERRAAGPGAPVRRRFRADGAAPYASADMLAHVDVFGPPEILCVWGLGVDAALLERCASSVRVYNSIDAPALRIPDEVCRNIDLFLASAPWQAEEISARYPAAEVVVMPIGPEFASPETFFATDTVKDVDVIYVAAAQDYKRHDILLDAFAALPPAVLGLCLFGYGDKAGAIRDEIAARGLNIVCIGPPGLSYPEVNALMNRAKIGVVCGVMDGAPAILTEYMLAGLPVLANEALVCGLEFIRPETGMTASAAGFAEGVRTLLARAPNLSPRDVVLKSWSWEQTVRRFAASVNIALRRKTVDRTEGARVGSQGSD